MIAMPALWPRPGKIVTTTGGITRSKISSVKTVRTKKNTGKEKNKTKKKIKTNHLQNSAACSYLPCVAAPTCGRHLEGPFLSPIRLAEAEWFGQWYIPTNLGYAGPWTGYPEPFLVLWYRALHMPNLHKYRQTPDQLVVLVWFGATRLEERLVERSMIRERLED